MEQDLQEEVVQPFFLCPISLQLMKDPVTIATGITYDRESIQKWFCYNHKTCPVTKQLITDYTLTPNCTLLSLIQSWRETTENPPKTWKNLDQTSTGSALHKLIFEEVIRDQMVVIKQCSDHCHQLKALKMMKSTILEINGDKYCRIYMEQAGLVLLLSSLITKIEHHGLDNSITNVAEEATNILYLLKPSAETLKKASEDNDGILIESLSFVIQHGSYKARIQSAHLLKSIFEVVDENYKADLRPDLFEGITEILKDHNSVKLGVAVLSILLEVIPFGRNKTKAVEAGVVSVLVELLAENNNKTDKRACEMMLEALQQLCGRAEGRAAFLAHPASVAVVASKILMVSPFANEKAVKVLFLVCRSCKGGGSGGGKGSDGGGRAAQELLEVGGVAKLFMVMQIESNVKIKEKAKEILMFHLKPWVKSSSPCFTPYCKIA